MSKRTYKILNFRVLIKQDENGLFVGSVPALPGCHSQGTTYEETIKNTQEAIELCLEVAKDNRLYNEKIDWSEAIDGRPRFIGVAEIPVKFGHPL